MKKINTSILEFIAEELLAISFILTMLILF